MSIHGELIVNMVTTWNTRCGIAAYSAFLTAELKKMAKIRIVQVPDGHTLSPYFLMLGFKTGRSLGIVHVQFAYGMFSNLKIGRFKNLSAFTALLFYLGLAFGRNQVITTFHELMKTKRAGGKIGLIYTKSLNWLVCAVSDLIIVHTKESKELMERLYGVNAMKIKVIPMGSYEAPTFLNKDECKKELNLSGKKVITIPGFVSRHKGHDLVIKLLPSLDNNIHLLIAGGTRTSEDEIYYEELKRLVQQLNCIDKITFNEDFPITPAIFNATDIAILPYKSATESMMLRLLVAYQVPTITSDLKVFKEIHQEYRCMDLFESNNSANLLEKIQGLLSDKKKQYFLKEKSMKMWEDTKWSSITLKHIETYLEVLSAHPNALYDSNVQKERLDWLKKNLSGNALEIGCATGFVTSYVEANVGLDINEYRLRLAKNNYKEKDFVLSDAINLPFEEKAFDTVLIPEILEHVPIVKAEKIISEARRVGKKLLITLPNAGKARYDKSLVETPEHEWFPTKEIVMKLIMNCKIEYTRENDFILVYTI